MRFSFNSNEIFINSEEILINSDGRAMGLDEIFIGCDQTLIPFARNSIACEWESQQVGSKVGRV